MANLKKLNINGVVYDLVDAGARTSIDTINTDMTSLSGKVTTLIGEDTGKSARTIANEELAKQLVPEGASESLDTLQEIAAWIQAHPEDASKMNEAIQGNASAITAINESLGEKTGTGTVYAQLESINSELESLGGGVGSIGSQIDTKINALDSEATSTDGTNVQVKVTQTDGKITAVNITKDETYKKPTTGIPLADLASGVQESLGKADSAYQKPTTGIAKTDLSSDVQTSLGKADTAVQHMEVDAESQSYLEITGNNDSKAFFVNVQNVADATAKGNLADAYDVKTSIEGIANQLDAKDQNLQNQITAIANGTDNNFKAVETRFTTNEANIAKALTATKETFTYDSATETLTITSVAI